MLIEAIIAIALAALIFEFVDSTLGMGYGTTLTPVLLMAGYEPLSIVPAILVSEFVTGLAAAFAHHEFKNVDFHDEKTWKSTALLSAFSAVGVIIAVLVAVNIPSEWLKMYIGVLVLTMGIVILATRKKQFAFSWKKLGFLGGLAAFNKGMSGGGYGPVMTGGQILIGFDPKQAIAITSLAEGVTCFVGILTFFATGAVTDWSLAPWLALGAMLSIPASAYTVKKASTDKLKLAIGVAVTILGIFTLYNLLL